MKLTKYMLAILGLGLVTMNAAAGVGKEYVINGVCYRDITKIRLFGPCTAMTVKYVKGTPGTEEVHKVNGPGILGQIAGPAGTATSGGLIRPAKVNVEQGGPSSDNFVPVTVTTPPAGNPDGNNGNGGNPHFN